MNVKSKNIDDVSTMLSRAFPIGAEIMPTGGVHFRVWAPGHEKLEVVIENSNTDLQPVLSDAMNTDAINANTMNKNERHYKTFELKAEKDGYFSGLVDIAGEGTLYRFRIDDHNYLYPDPASRFQPEGPHGPSQVIDPNKFNWTDLNWQGVDADKQIIYEMHIGTFTKEGTLIAAMEQLKELSEIGVTVIEMMPVAEFSGSFGWGYDGVDLYAPTRLYGKPEDYKEFINKAHSFGIGVILDVVYNHFGPDGNYLKAFTPDYFTDKYKNEWGEAINFDGRNSKWVREFFIQNAIYWISEYHFDGLRLDATQQIFDSSDKHIIAEVNQAVREAAGKRKTYIVAENEPQEVKLVYPIEKGGYGLDALWNDDLHHTATVTLSGHNEAYYTDYLGTPQEYISSFKWGYLYQGQHYKWQKQRRGTPTFGLKPCCFVTFIQNHDQIANSGRGERVYQLTSPGIFKAMTALFLLAPGTPMLFQGQEFASLSPFYYFADHTKDLAEKVFKGRNEFLSQFPSLATPQMQSCLPDPASKKTFESSKIDFSDRKRNSNIYKMHKDLLKLRREDTVLNSHSIRTTDGAVLSDNAFLLRFFAEDGMDRLLLVNFGSDLHLNPAPEPLLAPPVGTMWNLVWSSEHSDYGGCGFPEPESEENWFIQGRATSLFIPKQISKGDKK